MFVRVKTSPNSPKKAVQIVESYREGAKVKQKIVRHVGTALDDQELAALKDLGEHIKAKLEQEGEQYYLFDSDTLAKMAIEARNNPKSDEDLHVDLKKLKEEQRITTGIHDVYGQVYQAIGFDKVIPNPKRKVAAVKNLFDVVMGRIANPVSKLATTEMLSQQYGVNLSVSAIYRMMDHLNDQAIENIQKKAWQTAQSLFKDPIEVLFYDCTTLYFESFLEDELKENGYSKDMKFNQPQVLLALLVTPAGLPVGYEVFSGSTFEGHTLEKAIEKIESFYQINKLIFVADSAMLSHDNLKLLQSRGKDYIVGARIKNMSSQIVDEILDKQTYQDLSASGIDETLLLKQIQLDESRKLVVTYSSKRAKKDAYDREKAINKLLEKLKKSKNPKSLLSNFGYKKYVQVTGEVTVGINEEKIAADAQWDGLFGVITNLKEMPAEEVLTQYHGLWQIEQCFRLSKHDLKIRPVFHWTPRKVKAHIAICFMALTCLRYLNYRLKTQSINLSELAVRNALLQVQISILKHQQTGKYYGIPSRKTIEAEKIYKSLGIRLSDTPFLIK